VKVGTTAIVKAFQLLIASNTISRIVGTPMLEHLAEQRPHALPFQQFVGRYRNAITPAANLVLRHTVRRLRILHDHMQFGARSNRVRSLRMPEDGQCHCRRLVERFRCHSD
jgi:hypothetical protein